MPRIVDHEAQRAELLGKAFEIFSDQGYAATSMRELAKGLGVSTGTLYHYFGGKEDIFEQMVRWTSERDVQDALSLVELEAGPAQRLEAVFAWILANETYLQRRILLVFDFKRHRSDEAGRMLLEGALRMYRDTFTAILGKEGAAWSLMIGMLTQGLLEGGPIDPDAHREALKLLVSAPQNQAN